MIWVESHSLGESSMTEKFIWRPYFENWSEIHGAKQGVEEKLLEYQEQSKECPGTGSIIHISGLKIPRSALKRQTNLHISYLYLGFIYWQSNIIQIPSCMYFTKTGSSNESKVRCQ